MKTCKNCPKELPIKNKTFCSRNCFTDFRRGKSKSNFNQIAKNHIRIRFNGERKYLHRHLVETYVRPLRDGEIVHHKDENKFNNSLDNLEILDGRAKHLHLHDYFRGHRKLKSEAEMIKDFNEFGF